MNLPPDIDLSRDRKVDRLFHFWVKRDGLECAIDHWRLHEQHEQWRRDYEEKRQKEEDRLNAMARMRVYEKTTYKEIAKLFGYVKPQAVSHLLKPREERLKKEWHENKDRLEKMVKGPPPKLQFYLDKRVILQETCAMHMGGEEMLAVLNQLINLGSDNEKR
jgi:alkylated DNA nucleotide flippase Atl1